MGLFFWGGVVGIISTLLSTREDFAIIKPIQNALLLWLGCSEQWKCYSKEKVKKPMIFIDTSSKRYQQNLGQSLVWVQSVISLFNGKLFRHFFSWLSTNLKFTFYLSHCQFVFHFCMRHTENSPSKKFHQQDYRSMLNTQLWLPVCLYMNFWTTISMQQLLRLLAKPVV